MEIRTSWQYPANKNQQHVERYIQNLRNTAIQSSCGSTHTLTTSRNVTEPAKIRIWRMQILYQFCTEPELEPKLIALHKKTC